MLASQRRPAPEWTPATPWIQSKCGETLSNSGGESLILGGGNSNIWWLSGTNFTPLEDSGRFILIWGNDPIWRAYFSDGLKCQLDSRISEPSTGLGKKDQGTGSSIAGMIPCLLGIGRSQKLETQRSSNLEWWLESTYMLNFRFGNQHTYWTINMSGELSLFGELSLYNDNGESSIKWWCFIIRQMVSSNGESTFLLVIHHLQVLETGFRWRITASSDDE